MKIALFGASGQMGKVLTELLSELHPSWEILPVTKGESVEDLSAADGALDFSKAEALPEVLSYCICHEIPLVMGTTGQNEEEHLAIMEASKKIPLFYSGNFSLGVYVMGILLEKAAELLGKDADVELVESHHRKKMDAPSGTARMLLQSIEKGRGASPLIYGRSGSSPRKSGEIGVHALRGGTIVGEHEVMFALESEVLTIKHHGESRKLFAKGAVQALEFMLDRSPGYYTMEDLMKGRVR